MSEACVRTITVRSNLHYTFLQNLIPTVKPRLEMGQSSFLKSVQEDYFGGFHGMTFGFLSHINAESLTC